MPKILIFLLVLTTLAHSELYKKVISSGNGPDYNIALKTAQRNAVEQVVGLFLSSDSYSNNFVLINDNIYSKTRGYIKEYKVIKETKTEEFIQITIEAKVLITDLKKELERQNLILDKMEMPRILIINYNKDAKQRNIQKCYQGMVEVLTNNGFFVVDQKTLNDFYDQQRNIAYSELNNKIAEYGLKINADYVIKYEYLFSMEDRIAHLDAEIISTSTGKVLTTLNKTADISEKIAQSQIEQLVIARTIGKKISESLSQKLFNSWQKIIERGNYFTLVIEGYNSYFQILNLEKKIQDFKTVSLVKEIESGDKKTTLLLRYKDSTKNLKIDLLTLMKNQNWSVRLVRSENSRMFIKILR